MKSRIVVGLDGLQSLQADWEKLESPDGLPMQTFIWARAMANVFGRDLELKILVLEDKDAVVALVPLVRRIGRTRLEYFPSTWVNEPSDVLYSDPKVLPSLAAALVHLKTPLLFGRFPIHSAFRTALSTSLQGRGLFFARPDSSWPWITLSSEWEVPEQNFNAKRRAYLKRAQRIAEQYGAVRSEVLKPTPATLPHLLEEAMRVEAAGWKGKSGTALSLDSRIGGFYQSYAAAACEKGLLRLCFLRIAGRAVAMQIAIESHNRFWLMKIGYDEQFASCSPGNLLVRDTVRYAATHGLSSIAFLGVMESWKDQWTHEKNSCVILRGYPWGWRSMTGLTRDLAQSAWNKSRRILNGAKISSITT